MPVARSLRLPTEVHQDSEYAWLQQDHECMVLHDMDSSQKLPEAPLASGHTDLVLKDMHRGR